MDTANQPDTDREATQPESELKAPETDLTGKVLSGFRLLHRIGQGGMGQVYLAEQLSLKRKVAIKLLHPDIATNERALKRFKAEAQNVGRATHANIVQVYDVNEADGIHYIALEYVEGKNLREFIERKGTPELSLGLHILAQAAAALQRAGELGVIHRDIKPDNIMLTRKGEVKVADFGLSRCADAGHPKDLTQSQVVMGSPLYMSPEQVGCRPIDSRTDIYSLGVTGYYMFAGHPPFRGDSPVEVANQHLHAEPPPLCEVRPDLPTDLCAMIHKMMAKKPEDRYQCAREIVIDISRLRESLNLGAIAAISMSASFIAATSDAPREGPTKTWPIEQPRPSFLLRLALVASVLGALAIGLMVSYVQQQRVPPVKDPEPPPENPIPVKALFDVKEREKELKKRMLDHLDQRGRRGLEDATELGLFYLNQQKYAEADDLFCELAKRNTNANYQLLSRLGHAMVLAFQDQSAESNAEFLGIAGEFDKIEARVGPGNFFKLDRPFLKKNETTAFRDQVEAYMLLWKDNPTQPPPLGKVREMVAKAVEYNRINAPNAFPARLDAFRQPPRANVKAQ